jgi:hypothetical protein
MGVLDDDFAVNARKPRPSHPKGWEPGFEWDGKRGTVTTEPQTTPLQPGEDPDFSHILRFFGYDPEHFEVEGPVQHRAWQQKAGEPFLLYYRASIVRRGVHELDDISQDVEALVASVSRRKPRKNEGKQVPSNGAGLVVAMGDWQVGKSDGDGVEGTCARLAAIPDLIEQRWKQLRKIGVPLEVLYLCFGGDLRESCSGHYPTQQFRTHLNNRDQRKIIRAAADTIIDRSAGFAPHVAVKVVGGNHGEEREAGKANTNTADNVDVAVIEDVAYAYSRQPDRYGNVTFAIPDADLTLTFEHDGFIVGLAHGHQAQKSAGSGPMQKIHSWWKGQMDGQRPIGDADLLQTFHFHHPWVVQRGARTHIGAAALDGGSEYFIDATGQDAPPSTTSYVIDSSGWSRYQLLR